MQTFIYCKVTLHVSGVAATSLQRGLIRPRWREVAVPILWPVPEAAVTVSSTPDDGCSDTRNMQSDFEVNKYLHTVLHLVGFSLTLNTMHGTMSLKNSLTHSLTPCSRVLVEKLTCPQLVKIFHAVYEIMVHYRRHKCPPLSLFWASSIQYMPAHPTSWRTISILSSHLRLGLPSGLSPSGFPTKNLYTPSLCPIRATYPAHLILLDLITRTIFGQQYRSLSSSLCSFLQPLATSSLLDPIILLSTLF